MLIYFERPESATSEDLQSVSGDRRGPGIAAAFAGYLLVFITFSAANCNHFLLVCITTLYLTGWLARLIYFAYSQRCPTPRARRDLWIAGAIVTALMLLNAEFVYTARDHLLSESTLVGEVVPAQFMLAIGADPLCSDMDGNTPLHRTALSGAADICRLLLEHGADPNALNKSGDSPLDIAVRSGFPDVVRVLVAAGADPYRPDSSGISPYSLASAAARNRGDDGLLKAVTGESKKQ